MLASAQPWANLPAAAQIRRSRKPEAGSRLSPTPPDPYRGQSNVPVRRGVLRFRNCVRPSPPWRRYKSRHAARLRIRSLLVKEPEHDLVKDDSLPFHRHAHPPEGYLLNPRPLDAQFVERLLIVRRELFLLHLQLVSLDGPHFQVSLIAGHCNLALDPGRVAQQLRNQQPPLAIHLDDLPPVIHFAEKLLLRRIESGEPRQLLLDPLPFLEGIYLSNIPIQTCDVELLTIFLVDHPLELGRNLETALLVDPGWMIAAKHI